MFIAPVIASAAVAIGASATVAGIIGTIGATIIGLGISVGLSYAASKILAPDPASGANSATKERESRGAQVPRCMIVGVVATAGARCYDAVFGNDKKYAQVVTTLCDHEIEAVLGVIIEGKVKDLQAGGSDAGNYDYAVAEYGDKFRVNVHLGSSSQLADSKIVNNADPPSRWTSDCRLRGIAYVLSLFHYSEEKFPGRAVPQDLRWVVKGGRWYDPRKDSTQAGGSGAHRWSDKTTWTYSRNPYVALYNYIRGVWSNGQLWVGLGYDDRFIDVTAFMDAMNVCDEIVTNPDGFAPDGGDPPRRYAIDMIIEGGRSTNHRSVFDAVMRATAGFWCIRRGKFWVVAGTPRTPVATITDDDLLPGAPLTITNKRGPGQGLINAYYGTYMHAGNKYQARDLPSIVKDDDILKDGGRLEENEDFAMVTDRWQAMRLMEIKYKRSRLQWNGQITIGPRWMCLEAGDVIIWNSARFSWSKPFLITEYEDEDNQVLSATLTLQETDVAHYTFSNTELPEVNGVDGVDDNTNVVPQNFDADPYYITGDDGKTKAATQLFWDPPDDVSILDVIVEVRRVGASESVATIIEDAEAGTAVVVGGMGTNGDHEVRASWRKINDIKTRVWTDWVPVVSEGDDTGVTIAAGGNRLANTAFRRSMLWWGTSNNNTGITPTLGRDQSPAKKLAAGHTGYATVIGSPAAGTRFDVYNTNWANAKYQVTEGQSYEVSARVGVVGCNLRHVIKWYNAAGTLLLIDIGTTVYSTAAGGTILSDYEQTFNIFTAPAGAVSADVGLRATMVSGANPAIYWTQPTFAICDPQQQAPRDWSEGAFEEISLEDVNTSSTMIIGTITIDGINNRIVGTDGT